MRDKHNIIYICVGIATSLLILWGHHAMQPPYIKIIWGLSNFLGGYQMTKLFLSRRYNHQDASYFRVALFLMFYLLINLIVSAFHNFHYLQTTLFSPFYAMVFFLPVFAYMEMRCYDIQRVQKLYLLMMLLSLWSFRGYGFSSYFAILFYPLLRRNKYVLILFIVVLYLDVVYAFDLYNELGDSSRSFIIEFIIAILAILGVWRRYDRRLYRVIIFVLCIIPIIVIGMFIVYDISIFMLASDELTDAVMKLDTRTFLYRELLNDFKDVQTWVFGKGLDGGYYSVWFKSDSDDLRETIEVTYLHLLLKGGLLLVAAYIFVIVTAIKKSMKYSNNKLTRACALLLAGHLTAMCFSDYPSRTMLVQITPFICAALCMSDTILKMTDEEIFGKSHK